VTNFTTAPTTPIRNVSKTYQVVVYGRYESGSATVRLGTCTVIVSADGEGTLTASINGQPWALERADALLLEAREGGHLTLVEEFRTTIGNKAASAVHRELGRMRVLPVNRYQIAAVVVQRSITSLSQLQPHEVGAVLQYAAALTAGAA
jgi:hypothetical protein